MAHSYGGNAGGHWHPGMGSHPADRGYAGPGGPVEGESPGVPHAAGGATARKNTQSADPVIKDNVHRHNIQASSSERHGPIGAVQVGRSFSQHDYAATGRNVRIMSSSKGNTDFRRVAQSGD